MITINFGTSNVLTSRKLIGELTRHVRSGIVHFLSFSFDVTMHCRSEIKTKEGKLHCPSTELDLGITLNGGQSFRWVSYNGGYRGVFGSCVWMLTQDETHLSYKVYDSSESEINYHTALLQYFRLDVSLKDLCKKWTNADEHFQKSSTKVNGVRILNQDVVENLFSFICSSNNNIQRISSMVEKLCKLFGEKICSIENEDYYKFPTIESLNREDVETILREQGFGYRAGYIANTAKRLLELGGREWLSKLHKENNCDYSAAREKLITLPGVGPKVADCVCLMSLGHLEAIPVDTHIFQVARANYLPYLEKQKTVTPKIHEEVSNHLRKLWGPFAGWAQAVVFCAKINTNGVPSENQKRKTVDNNAPNLRRKRKR